MKIREVENWLHTQLLANFNTKDYSLNGLQVGDSDREVKKMAFAVDACMESFRRAANAEADLLFVHHGMFWGQPLAITGDHYRRVQFLLENQLALYASHLPLDMHPEFGNNAELCRFLGLEELKPFGKYNGNKISYKGTLPEPISLDEAIERVFPGEKEQVKVLPFGPKEIQTVALITGGGAHETLQAIEEGLDLYITGEPLHQVYHPALEAGMNVLFGGHYYTEIWGTRALQKKIEEELGLETVFIDVPTGL